jgi:hypothetical protein
MVFFLPEGLNLDNASDLDYSFFIQRFSQSKLFQYLYIYTDLGQA